MERVHSGNELQEWHAPQLTELGTLSSQTSNATVSVSDGETSGSLPGDSGTIS